MATPVLALGGVGRAGRFSLRADALQQRRRRLIVGVLGDQLAGEGLLEDTLAQPLGPLQAGPHGGFGLLDDGQATFYLHDYPALLSEGWKADGH